MIRNLQLGVVFLATTLLVLAGATTARSSGAATERSVLVVTVRLGDICAHDTVPPSPQCAPQPLSGARLRLLDAGGSVVASGKSNAAGKVVLAARAGTYTLVARAVEHVRITPRPQSVTLRAVTPRYVVVTYFTGIQ